MTRTPHILVVGSFVMDLITSTRSFPSEGQTVLGCDFRMAPGGKGANQAVQAARLGARVSMIGKVGNDLFGKRLLESSRISGIDVRGVKQDDTAPSAIGNVMIEDREGGALNRIIVVPGANMTIRPEDVACLTEDIEQYDMVILQMEIPMEINVLVAQCAQDHGIPVMLNSAPSGHIPVELLRNVTYISPNEHEAADITGIMIDVRSRSALTDTSKAVVQRLLDAGVEHAMITLGERGAAFGDNEEFFLSPCRSGVSAVDPTAAGDSFVAAFCTAVCSRATHRQAVLFANCAAAITVSRMGAQPSLPTLEEVKATLSAEDKEELAQVLSVLEGGKKHE